MPLLAEGEFALASQHLERALKQSGELEGDHDIYAPLADAAAQQRNQAALVQYASLAEATARRVDHRLYQGIARRAWGVLHRLSDEYPQAEARLKQALDIFAGLDTRWQIGRTLFELGELALLQGNKEAARHHFSDARAAFDALRAAPDVARVRTALEALG